MTTRFLALLVPFAIAACGESGPETVDLDVRWFIQTDDGEDACPAELPVMRIVAAVANSDEPPFVEVFDCTDTQATITLHPAGVVEHEVDGQTVTTAATGRYDVHAELTTAAGAAAVAVSLPEFVATWSASDLALSVHPGYDHYLLSWFLEVPDGNFQTCDVPGYTVELEYRADPLDEPRIDQFPCETHEPGFLPLQPNAAGYAAGRAPPGDYRGVARLFTDGGELRGTSEEVEFSIAVEPYGVTEVPVTIELAP